MTLPEYQALLEGVRFGKRLPAALYVYYSGEETDQGLRTEKLKPES